MPWFQLSHGVIRFRGVTRPPFLEWAATAEGHAAVAEASHNVRFGLFGRRRAARRALWKALQLASNDASLRDAIQLEADQYRVMLSTCAYLEGLPRAHVQGYRLVAVPRSIVNGRAQQAAAIGLQAHAAVVRLPGGPALRDFFYAQLVEELDNAIVRARPGTSRPIAAAEQWASVGLDLEFSWVPASWPGSNWPGHHFLYEIPRGGLTRRLRRDLDAAIADLARSVSLWSRLDREDALRAATRG